MGISFSCPLAAYTDLENGLESVIIKSISFGNGESKTPVRSISFRTGESDPTIFQSKGIGKMAVEGSVSLETTETETKISITAPPHTEMNIQMDNQSPRSDTTEAKVKQLLTLDLSNPKHEAAIKLQKVYKSFRTRRKLADCAVLIEQSWWKLLDFAELKRSSISFFDIEKHETAISRWSRARTRAAKVGKGLSKNSRAQKLALQHWLEAIDPRHRYGHNLHFYFVKWLHSQSKEPFFYWLDIGEGKEVNLVDKCPRSKLQQQCIKYLGPMERKAYEVIVEDGKFIYKQSGELLDTTREPKGAKWIFVLSTSMNLYVGLKKKGTFQHSSFLAGGATSAAGRIIVENGSLKAVWPHSGHYQPTPENFQDFISFLRGNNVDLTDIKMDPADEEEEESSSKRNNVYFRSISSDEDLAEKDRLEREEMETEENSSEKMNLSEEEENANASELPPQMRSSRSLKGKLTNLSIPDRDDLFEELKHKNQTVSNALSQTDSSPGSYATAQNEMVIEQDLSDDDVEDNRDEGILKESILERINSHKGMNSYQLGKQLSFKWTTGAGPRIGCLRDYPPKLQFRALEKVKLSPRCAIHYRSKSSRDVLVNGFSGEIDIKKMSFSGELPRTKQCTSQFSPLCKGFSASGDEELS